MLSAFFITNCKRKKTIAIFLGKKKVKLIFFFVFHTGNEKSMEIWQPLTFLGTFSLPGLKEIIQKMCISINAISIFYYKLQKKKNYRDFFRKKKGKTNLFFRFPYGQ